MIQGSEYFVRVFLRAVAPHKPRYHSFGFGILEFLGVGRVWVVQIGPDSDSDYVTRSYACSHSSERSEPKALHPKA